VSTKSGELHQLYDGDKTTLAESLDFIQKTAEEIIVALTDEEQPSE
jgi:hypothetical protein